MGAACCGGHAEKAEPCCNEEVAEPAQTQPSRAKDYEAQTQPQGVQFGYQPNFAELYEVGKELGKGQYGTTYVCVEKKTRKEYAVKKVSKASLNDKQAIDDLVREVKILTVLQGKPNIVQFYGSYEDKGNVYMVLEYCRGGELFERLLEKGKYSERDASTVMRQILQAVADCHINGVIHRDLKPENFLYESTADGSQLKVTDFGLSDFFSVSQPKPFDDVAGSAYYVAPEVLRRKYGPTADLWSCGVIMYILLTGEVPFWAPTEAGIFKQVLQGQLDLHAGPCKGLSQDAKHLMLSLLTRDTKFRNAEQNGIASQIKTMQARYSAARALAHPWIAQDGIAPDAPLDVRVIQNMSRFASYNRVKKAILIEIAKTFKETEISDLRRQFAVMDKDNSGTISIDEMFEAMTRFKTGENGKPVFSKEEISRMMKTMDVDEDGQVDYMEFVAASMSAYQMSHGLTPGTTASWLTRVRVVFDKIDEDGNGYITSDELVKLMGDDEGVREIIQEADKNGDGLIDYEEFHLLLRESVRGQPTKRSKRAK